MNEVSTGATLVTVGMAAVATIGSAVTAYFGYRTNRDKLEFDAERVQMRLEMSHMREGNEECHRERENQAVEIRELRDRIDEMSGMHRPLQDRRREQKPHPGPDRRGQPHDPE